MKLKHILLFITACTLLMASDFLGGSLIALALFFQLNLLMNNIKLTKQSQLTAFNIFLFTIPVSFFWGGVHSFAQIYYSEQQWLFFITANVIILSLSVLISIQTILIFHFLESANFNIAKAYDLTFQALQKEKKNLVISSSLLFIFSFVPWLATDWKLIFAITATGLYLNRSQLRRAFASDL